LPAHFKGRNAQARQDRTGTLSIFGHLALPTLQLNPDIKSIFDFTFDDIAIMNYQAHPHIQGSVSV